MLYYDKFEWVEIAKLIECKITVLWQEWIRIYQNCKMLFYTIKLYLSFKACLKM